MSLAHVDRTALDVRDRRDRERDLQERVNDLLIGRALLQARITRLENELRDANERLAVLENGKGIR